MTIRASVVIAGALSMFFLAALAAQEAPPNVSIGGVVTQIGTGAPLAGARVNLTATTPPRGLSAVTPADIATMSPEARANLERERMINEETMAARARGPMAPPPIPSATSDDKGQFSFPSLAVGTYRLQVQANGYVPLDYGQRYAGGPGTPITLAAGESKTDVAVQLTPAGNIGGRLRDVFEQPLSNVPVQLLRPIYGPMGERSLQVVGGARTDDRGEYRIYWVTPGRYYLKAGVSLNGMEMLLGLGNPAGGGPNPNEVVPNVSVSFFPGTPDLNGARALEIMPGVDVSGVDWTLQPQVPGRRVRGRLVDSRTGRPPSDAMVMISSGDLSSVSGGLEEMFGFGLRGRSYNPSTGMLEFRNVQPGVYSIGAVMEEPPERPEGAPFPAAPVSEAMHQPKIVSGSTTVAVADRDVDDIVVTVTPAGSLSGRLRAEGSFPAGRGGPPRFNINLNPTRRSVVENYYGGVSAVSAVADEIFRLTVPYGEYRLNVQLPSGGYIKSAQLDGVDILESPLVLMGVPSGSLDIVVSSNSGQIQGNLVDERSEPIPMMQVVLVPNRSRGRIDLYKVATTDSAGRFTINGVAPGDYKVFSWQSIDRFSWFDPQVLERWEDRGSPVHISESSVENIQVRIVPSGGAQ